MKIEPTIGKWIKTEDALPTEKDWYLGTFQETDTGWINPIPFICDYLLGERTAYTTNDGWILKDCTDNENVLDYYKNLRCIAWMPLPEPFYQLS